MQFSRQSNRGIELDQMPGSGKHRDCAPRNCLMETVCTIDGNPRVVCTPDDVRRNSDTTDKGFQLRSEALICLGYLAIEGSLALSESQGPVSRVVSSTRTP